MSYLPAAVTLVGVLGVLNLAVTLGLARRVRQQSELVAMSIEGVTNPKPIMLTAGRSVGEFDATTVDGEPVRSADLRGPTLVGFVSPGCPACAESLPAFVARAGTIPGGRRQVLAVVVGAPGTTGELRDRLAPVARVVAEPAGGPVAVAFGVDGFPAFALLSDDTVVGSHFALDRIPEAAAT